MEANAIVHVGGCCRSFGSLIVFGTACICCVMAGGRFEGFEGEQFENMYRRKIGVELYDSTKKTEKPEQITATSPVQRLGASHASHNSSDIAFTVPDCIPDFSGDIFDISCVWTGNGPLTIVDMRLIWTQADGHVADFDRWLGLCGVRDKTMIGDQMWVVVHSCSTFLNMDSIPAKAGFQARASWSRMAPPMLTPYVSCMVRGDNATHMLTIVSPPTPVVFCGPRKTGVPWPANEVSADAPPPKARRTATRVASTEAILSTAEESTAGMSDQKTLEGWSLRTILAPLAGALGVGILLLTVGVCMCSDEEKDGRKNRVREFVPAAGPDYSTKQFRQQSTSHVASSLLRHSPGASAKEAASAASVEMRRGDSQSAVPSVARTAASSSAASVRSASVASMHSRLVA